MTRYTIIDFTKDYPDDDACLEEVFKTRYGFLDACPHCGKFFSYSKVKSKKKYKCSHCGGELAPLADTIFHKSPTPLKTWFYAIYLFSVSKNGVSAKELERQLGVTYKCAWRMANQIRKLFDEGGEPTKFQGTVEVDETYVGGKKKGKRGRGAEGKSPVIGVVEREGKIKAIVTQNTNSKTILPIIEAHVSKDAKLMTDEYRVYDRVSLLGYKHERINHSSKVYAIGDVHTNTIEGFWSQLKRSLNGTYHSVSPKYLQNYVDEFAYRYNRRKAGPLFQSIVSLAAAKAV